VAAVAHAQPWKRYFTSYAVPHALTRMVPKDIIAAKDGGAYARSTLSISKIGSSGLTEWTVPYFNNLGDCHVIESASGIYVIGYADRGTGPGLKKDFEVYVLRFDLTGHFVFCKLLGMRQLSLNSEIKLFCDIDSTENVFVSDGTAMAKCTKAGVVTPGFAGAFNLHVDHADNLIFTTSLGSIEKFSPANAHLYSAPTTYQNTQYPSSALTIGSDNAIYTALQLPGDSKGAILQKFSSQGLLLWSSNLFAGYDCRSIWVDPTTGAINLFGSAWIKLNPSGGNAIGIIIPGLPAFVDSSGYAYFAVNNTIEKYSPGGTKVGTFDLTALLGVRPTDIVAITFSGNSVYCVMWDGDHNTSLRMGAARFTLSGSNVWTNTNVNNNNINITNVKAFTTSVGTTYLFGRAFAVGPAGSTAVAAFDKDGKLLFCSMTTTDLGDTRQIIPDQSGDFYVAGTRGIARYSSAGLLRWTNSAGALEMGLDSSGNLLGITGAGNPFKIDPNGNQIWLKTNATWAFATVDPSGNLIAGVGGHVLKYNPVGTLIVDTLYAPDLMINSAFDVMTDSLGNQYFTCELYVDGTMFGVIAKCSPSGNELWEKEYVAYVNSWSLKSILNEKTGKLYTVGYALVNYVQEASVGQFDMATGNMDWTKSFTIGKHSQATDIVVDPEGHLLVRGWTYELTNSFDDFLMRLTPKGDLEQILTFDSGFRMPEDMASSTVPQGGGVSVDEKGFAYVYGASIGPDVVQEFQVSKFGLPPPDDATITQDVNMPMAGGATYQVAVTATNTGMNNWNAAGGYMLDCLQTNWNAPPVGFNLSDNIANGKSKIFVASVTAPTTPGTYPLQWQMEHNGAKFSSKSPIVNVTVLAQTNFATFVGQNVPASMAAGQAYGVNVQYKNTGSNMWSAAGTQQLRSISPFDNKIWAVNRLPLTNGSVPGGQIGTFGGTIIAPTKPGTYTFQWEPVMESNHLPFGTPSPLVSVVVSTVPDAARFVSRTGTLSVYSGTDFYTTNTMLNVGSNTWSTSAGYSMMSINPANNVTWGGNRIPIPASIPTVGPGGQVTFSKLCTAPATPGAYTMQWQMNKNGTPFGNPTTLVTINVYAAADNAQFVSQGALPSNVGPSTTYSITTAMKNVGTATWNSTYSLVSIGTSDFGVAGVPSGTVVPNTNASLTATFTAPATPGAYVFQWRMAHNGTKFGQATNAISITVSADAAQYLSRSGAVSVSVGSDFYATYSYKNTGTTSWTGPGGYYLSFLPANVPTWGATRINIPATIAPGAVFTNAALCAAPVTPGVYNMQWQMMKSGVAFGDRTPVTSITVVDAADNAQFFRNDFVPTTIVHGTTFNATVIMQNLGTATWNSTYSLVPIGTSNFGITGIPAVSTIKSHTDSFSATFTAPATPGTYRFQWRMSHGGVMFGQPSAVVTITVT